MDLRAVLLRGVQEWLQAQSPQGSMLAGRNGSYGDPETPVRCTTHALVAFCHAYEATGDGPFKSAARAALGYLLAVFEHSPGCVTMRHAPPKDYANGVIGQAFVAEGFHAAWRTLGSLEARDAGLALILRHPFSKADSCWHRIDPRGEALPPDATFNHQLFFAAIAAMYRSESQVVDGDLSLFLEGLRRTLRLREDGRIVHVLPSRSRRVRVLETLGLGSGAHRKMLDREADYHLYNCYIFALMAQFGIDVAGHLSSQWQSIRNFAHSEVVTRTLSPTAWSIPLRSGTETRVCDFNFFNQAFGGDVDLQEAARFLVHSLGPDGSGTLLSPDPVTQKARSYRYWRLLNWPPPK